MSISHRSPARTIFEHPKNAWYAAAWDHEVTSGDIIARTVANHPLALYRTVEGLPVALADACWHRLAPLSMGRRVGRDGVQCPYHGLQFDSAGRCIFMPAQETINPSAVVASFPAVERHRFIWVWTGDPHLADPSTIPDMHQLDSPEWAGDGQTIDVETNFQLILDNLMDLTHEEFVHVGSIGQTELSGSDFEVSHDDSTVTLTRWMHSIDAPPFLARNMQDRFPDFAGKVDRWQIVKYQAPATICIDVGVAAAGTGAPEGDRSQGITNFVMNTITPVTATHSHYHWAIMRNYALERQSATTRMRESVSRVFKQDERMIVAQQAAILANPDYEFYSLNIDAGGMWVRRILERMLAAEATTVSA